MKNYIVWDWNGTLLDDLELCFHTINQLLLEESLKPLSSLQDYRQYFQFPICTYYKALGFDFNQTSFELLAKRYMDEYQPASLHCDLHVASQTVIRNFYEQGKKQYLLSASQLTFLKKQLAQYDISPYFESILGLNDFYAHSKQALAKNWLLETNINPKEVVFIGDSVHDFEVASSIGCDCILVAAGHQDKKRLLACGVPVVDGLSQVIEIIKQMDDQKEFSQCCK